jgi:flagellar biosynthesis GTPase FlhF
MQSFYEYLRSKAEAEEEDIEEEEREEREEKREEKEIRKAETEREKKEVNAPSPSPSPSTQQFSQQNPQAELLKQHILEARLRFINKYPQLADKIDQIYQVAVGLLGADYQKGKLRHNDFFDYLKEATELYAKTIESEHQFFSKNPIRFKDDETKVQGRMTRKDYHKFYVEEFLPSITKEGNFIEYITYPDGIPVPRFIRGREKYNTFFDLGVAEKENT